MPMPRLFDEPEPAKPAPGDAPMSISQLVNRIKSVVNQGIPGKVRVVGEISNLSDRNHWFFSLKDGQSAIRCVMFASAARAIGFPAAGGMEVVATGRVDVYPAQGQVQFYVDRLEPVGQGALELKLKAMVAELRRLGYFELEHKRPIPAFARRIAVVTSRSAAALQDVIDTAHRRWPGCELLLCDVRVQGEQAAPEISQAIRMLSRDGDGLGVDAIILTRGGGSIEDLWAFNERAVADAVYECGLPVVAAIGHETDTTVAELVADHRCATPTQAAMLLVPDREAMAQQVEYLAQRLGTSLRRQATLAQQRLDAVARHTLFARPERLVDQATQRLDQSAQRLNAAIPRRLQLAQGKIASLSRHLEAVGPMQVLKRGYTYTTGDDGQVLRSAASAKSQQALKTVFTDGAVDSTVDGPGATESKPRKRKPKRLDPEAGLFG